MSMEAHQGRSVRKKRILIVSSWARSLINFRGPLLFEMFSCGFQVHVAAPSIPQNIQRQLTQRGFFVHETPLDRNGLNPLRDLRYFSFLRKLMKTIGPDIVLSYTIKPNIWSAIAARLERKPAIAMVTGLGYALTNKERISFKQRLARIISLMLLRISTGCNVIVLFQNPDDLNDLRAMGGLAKNTETRIINGSGVDLDLFSPQPLPQRISFLMASRLKKNKGVREYCNAAVKLKKMFPEVRFAYAGSFSEGPDNISKKELDEWIAGGLDYLGWQADIRRCLTETSVFVLPSYREGTPRSVLEAMATGRPIITTDAPGCRETTVNGVNGFLVPIADDEAIAEKMRFFIEFPDAVSCMGRESLRIAHEKYGVDKVNNQILSSIQDTLP